MKISLAKKEDILAMVCIAQSSFRGMRDLQKAKEWITGNFRAYPRMQYFVAKESGKVIGYVLWLEKGGFRKEAVFELEQIAVKPEKQGQGIGSRLIQGSLLKIEHYLKKRGDGLKLIEVTTGTENKAQQLYRKVLGAKVEAKIKNFFRDDEVIMIARYCSKPEIEHKKRR